MCSGIIVGIKRPQPAPSPTRHEIGRTGTILAAQPQLIGNPEQRPEDGGAIVVDQFDQPGLLNEAAQLDQMPGAGASIMHPLPLVVAGPSALETIVLHGQMPELRLTLP